MDDLPAYEAAADSRTALSYRIKTPDTGMLYRTEIEYVPGNRHIDPEALEQELGGIAKDVDGDNALTRMDQYINEVYTGLADQLNGPEHLAVRVEADALWGEEPDVLEAVDSMTRTQTEEHSLLSDEE